LPSSKNKRLNSKYQQPNSKKNPKSSDQITKTDELDFDFCNLEIHWILIVGVWNLKTMSRIIPAILVDNENEFRRQISLAVAFASIVQLDVLDGTLFPERSWNNAKAAAAMHLAIPFEAHLMVNNPELKAPAWVRAGAQRVIVHVESKGSIGMALEQVRQAGRLAGVALNPETELAIVKDLIPFIDHIQLMGVQPGAQGRPFDPETTSRVRALKKMYPHITIAVDGGVTDMGDLARQLAAAGADDLVVGSALWKAKDPARAYHDIMADANI
jgi:ribulose-phosphate 3-epimerase